MDDRGDALKMKRHDVLGVPVDLATMSTTLHRAREMLAGDRPCLVVATNPEKVVAARRNPELARALREADLVIPDGIGVVLAARLAGHRDIARVPGSELMPELCALAAEDRHPVFLYGAKPEIVTKAARLLQQRYPGLEIAGTQHGYLESERMPELIEAINASGARMLFVGLGSPRQELWMVRYRDVLTGVRVCQGVGGTFDALCGHPRRAPALMRRMNLEWLYRLVTQPSRLHRQSALPLFAVRVLQDALSRTGRARRL
ncbi:MAG: WecB/TagA/CpsF family glycosyltransferase [Ectothiorhodospiraceae bacterium]|nr:WecB/TagA/CpsF family glycosyltransferase [Paracoccaceae bacterium]MCH8505862.1 WecB/TagA/CpsF family glycosyltransferase [Ectothiorhodospiraceae bacterium]